MRKKVLPTIKRRDPMSLELEAQMLKALVKAKWTGQQVAGFIAAQRRDGILSFQATRFQLRTELQYWSYMSPAMVRTRLQLPEVELAVKRCKLIWTCTHCGHEDLEHIEKNGCSECSEYSLKEFL